MTKKKTTISQIIKTKPAFRQYKQNNFLVLQTETIFHTTQRETIFRQYKQKKKRKNNTKQTLT